MAGKRIRRVEGSDDVETTTPSEDVVAAQDAPAPQSAPRRPAPKPKAPLTQEPAEKPAEKDSQPSLKDELFTIPNLLSAIRIVLVPVFLWLVLVPERDVLAIGVLVVSGITDYLDGKIARATGRTTRLGAILDPVADRLYILAVVVGLGLRDIIPWWLAVILPLRDVVLFSLVPFLRTRGFSALPVHFLGKAATAGLLYAFPLLLLGDGDGAVANLARVFGWAFTVWGVALYWWAGILYAVQVRRLLASTPRTP
ncbi:CDP-alcohol phosphatidyltransferase family protein [Aeromicrobium duanguangcaii]|uniref:CDP-alcohol phosphatidyltransferase family protein n=1 Tax=Aeromicrobium duanguangcaii TaxID=2968086 RepID=A0ABY5KDJ1_9ACTN|nr:CDP-alcohol phosphatidyltransferase family protein [Aeromicrobium duanguangcaii]MCD9152871.1 CDP-alcohol phosphatidyltransferase family protein [Aeromicrobium duanguangcaii]UUI67150.1 CDP-alcohol phosphatidyltransferase family protein [Aeromicrobium duanguangcaii]